MSAIVGKIFGYVFSQKDVPLLTGRKYFITGGTSPSSLPTSLRAHATRCATLESEACDAELTRSPTQARTASA